MVLKHCGIINVYNYEIYIPHLYSTPPSGRVTPSEFRKKMFSTRKLERLGYHTLKKVWWYLKPFRYNTGTWQTDGRTDRIAISILRVSIAVLTGDENAAKQACSACTSWSSVAWFSERGGCPQCISRDATSIREGRRNHQSSGVLPKSR